MQRTKTSVPSIIKRLAVLPRGLEQRIGGPIFALTPMPLGLQVSCHALTRTGVRAGGLLLTGVVVGIVDELKKAYAVLEQDANRLKNHSSPGDTPNPQSPKVAKTSKQPRPGSSQ